MSEKTLGGLPTEGRNPASAGIDRLPTLDMLRVMNAEDRTVARAVEACLPDTARAVDAIAGRLGRGGRLFYAGAGTSGRLGVLDASECPPTYGVPEGVVTALIAGGREALFHAAEGAEDDRARGRADAAEAGVSTGDALVGVSASGRTPWTLGAMEEAARAGALVVALVCAAGSPMARAACIAIEAVTGPEVIAGSTRMKAGTAQKMVLNMLSTGVMVRLGKVYGNLMVDVRATNEKLRGRARRIVIEAAGVTAEEAEGALQACGYECKPAILSLLKGLDADAARERLARHGGVLARALDEAGE